MLEYDLVVSKIRAIVKEVASMQLTEMENKTFGVKVKASNIDFVTTIDLKSEELIRKGIWEHYPDHGIFGEEGGLFFDEGQEPGSDYQWIIDPIDGTTNFVHGFPLYVISIGLKYQGTTVLGYIYAPVLKQEFYAIKDQGTYMNGKKMSVSKTDTVKASIIGTGFPYGRAERNMNLPYFLKMVNNVSGIRRTGSAALDLALVSIGALDGYWEFDINEWDVCAGRILIQEAGGIVEELEVDGDYMMITSNPYVFDEFRDMLMN